MLTQANSRRSFLLRVWRYRAAVASLLALILALYGEALQRTTPDVPASDPQLGHALIVAAVILVGLAAWVRDDFPRFKRRARISGSEPPASPVSSLPVRRAGGSLAAAPLVARPARRLHTAPEVRPVLSLGARYTAFRRRAGWAGTAVGLLVVLALATACYFLLSGDFSNPIAPWVWAAMLAALVLTFAGTRPLGASPLTHDPAEPREEPPVSRAEWVLIGLILLAAALLRFWDLEHIPAGPYIDEADRALRARYINGSGPSPLEYLPFSFFSTDWWGVPTAYFWLVAQSLKVFGDTLAGARTVHVLAGIGTVWYTYRVGRIAWSPRAGLIAAALLTVSDFAIQFSRTAGESTITLFTWAVCFYYLYKALKTMRLTDFALSGIAGGLTLYGYVSGKLLPLFMIALAVYLLVRWGFSGARRLLPGLVVLALAAFLTFAPNGLFVLRHPEAFTMRYNGTAIFIYPDQFMPKYNTHNWGVVIAGQYGLTYSAFDVGSERGPFYPTHQPILPVPWAALWVLGTAYMVWRVGDGRYAVLGTWLLAGLAGAALTNDTPTLQRVAGMVPTLALIPALYLDRLVSSLLAFPVRFPRVRWRPRLARIAANAAVVALIALLAFQTLSFYFGPYTAEAHYLEFMLEGRYAQQLDPATDILYQSGVPALLGSQAPTFFLAGDVGIKDYVNSSDELPLIDNQGKNANLIFWPRDDRALGALKSLYPEGVTTTLSNTHGDGLYSVFRVTNDQLNSERRVTARYSPAAGQFLEREETRLGTLHPPDSPAAAPLPAFIYPVRAEWRTGLVIPAYGIYNFSLRSTRDSSLTIDGTQVISSAGSEAVTRVVLAKGLHQVILSGTLPDLRGQVELRWGAGDNTMSPIARKFYWSGTEGSLLGRYYGRVGGPELLTDPSLLTDLSKLGDPASVRRDVVLSWRDINASANMGPGMIGIWQGGLNIPHDGGYLFDVDTDGMCTIWVDGKMIGSARVPNNPTTLPIIVPLTRGTHRFEVRFQAQGDHNRFTVLWQGPGIDPGALPAWALSPVGGGVWPLSERPNAPAPGADAVAADYPAARVSVSTVLAGQPWHEPGGLAALPGGAFVLFDRANSKIDMYAGNGALLRSWATSANIGDLAAAPDGTIAALDTASGSVLMYTPDGRQVGVFDPAALSLNTPAGIAWAPDGTLYVADTGANRILHVTRSGAVLGRITGTSTGYRPLDRPLDVAAASDGAIYLVDSRGRVLRIGKSGSVEAEYVVPVGTQGGGSKLALWGDKVVVSNPEGHSIAFLDPTSGSVTVRSFSISGTTALTVPSGLAVTPDGRLLCLDRANNRVLSLAAQP